MNEASSKTKTRMESIGPILLLIVLALFVIIIGLIQSVISLPEVDLTPNFADQTFGDNKHGRKIINNLGKSLMMWPVKDLNNNSKEEEKDNDSSNVILVDGVTIPRATWPTSIRNEDGDFEDILHPADMVTKISVPKFWSGPLNNGNLITRNIATRIGTYVSTNGQDNVNTDIDYNNRGNADDRTIFVAIASYRDFQCRLTVESLFNRAKFPNRLRVVAVDQITEEDPSCGVAVTSCNKDKSQALCKYKNQIDILEIDAKLAVGPIFARHLGHRMYRGEYYAMQIDAHVTFVQDWDVDIINQFESTHNEMAVLSTYLTDIVGSIDENGRSKRNTRPIMCNTDFEGSGAERHLRHMSQPECRPNIKGTPQLQPYWAAGWSFSRGHFIVNVPYDLYAPMVFMGEEMSVGIRGFTYGYDHYASASSICFHTYANGINAVKRNKVPKYWENGQSYNGMYMKGMKRLLGIVKMNPQVQPSEWVHDEEDFFGIGKVRDPMQFYKTFGIDVVKKKTQHHLCSFVQTGNMHRQFTRFLRSDGMGIDFSKIDYEFKDPRPGQK